MPSTGVVGAAFYAARRVNDYATAVRVFEGVRKKVKNKQQYQAYTDELKPVGEELGIQAKEESTHHQIRFLRDWLNMQ
ncbi:COX5A-domain-containing protein [Leucogyrophana mollusca]|uniref:COX5A-domain-containing protein n=1 Tax=Leucogyrophana mollusca TaxID=85980 RepID=A0ACB8BMJ5_9AGAM|nr:COX5A-domain-containing protein [Leucogyrophana mollusca]